MKRMTTVLWLLALAAALLTGCAVRHASAGTDTEPDAPDPGDGYTVDRSDPDAPKAIQSKQVIAIDCWFSTMDDAEPGALGNHIYQLSAKLSSGAVRGSYEVSDTGESRSFRDSHDFLNQVFELADRYELAQLNGHAVEAKGLPKEYGVELDIQYASGEHIRVYDNQENVLPYNFLNETVKLFEDAAAVTPTVLDFRVDSIFAFEEVNGGYGEVRCPTYALGYLTSDGEEVVPDGYDALKAAVADIDGKLQSDIPDVWKRFGKVPAEGILYNETEAFVTRADSEVVSFYQRTKRYEDASDEREMTEIVTHNLKADTGRELKFSDVFRDMDYLPSLLLMEFSRAYPKLELYDDALNFIRQSVQSDDGNISFALGYGCVHIFADEYVLCGEPGELHTTISYILNPGQVRSFYTTAPKRWMIPLDEGVNYYNLYTSDCFRILTQYGGLNGDELTWDVMFNNDPESTANYAEAFYGVAPQCWLIHSDRRDFIYLRLPTGDMSLLTNVYEITQQSPSTAQGISKRSFEPLELTVRENTPLNPDWMLMSLNLPILAESVQLLPYGAFRVDEDGMPELASGVYDLSGPWVRLREGGRYNPDSRDNAAVSGGMWTLIAGQRLRPYQTDLSSFLDFITDDGRVVRFSIDDFYDGMKLDNFGTLDDVFVPDEEVAVGCRHGRFGAAPKYRGPLSNGRLERPAPGPGQHHAGRSFYRYHIDFQRRTYYNLL